jgi:hypothetical protein
MYVMCEKDVLSGCNRAPFVALAALLSELNSNGLS